MVYYGDEFGISGAADPDNRRNMKFDSELNKNEKSTLEFFSKIAGIRNNHPALRYGSRRPLLIEKDQYAFIKSYFNDRVIVVFNREKKDVTLNLNAAPEFNDGIYKNLISGGEIIVKDGKLEINLKPQSAAFISN